MKKSFLLFFIFANFVSLLRAQNCNYICNGDFDSIQYTSTWINVTSTQLPCWHTTATNNFMEIWHTGYNGVPSYSGNQHMEINASMPATVYQDIVVSPGTNLAINFAHRGRGGIDTISVTAGPVGGPYTLLGIFGDPDGLWAYYTVNYIVPNLGNNYSIRFNSVYWGYGNPGVGNFLDAVSVCGAASLPGVNIYSSDTNFCGKQCIDFYDISTNNPTSWQWSFPGSATPTSTLQNPVGICYNSYGSFDVTLIACNTAGCDSIVLHNFINEFPSAVIPAITQSNDTLFALSGFTFQWYEVNNGLISGATNNYFVSLFPGSYYVIIADSNGCGASSDIVIVANTCEYPDERDISFFPNPNNGNFTISRKLKSSQAVNLKIYNRMGKMICMPIPVNQGITDISLKDYNIKNGLYLMIFCSDRYLFSQKLIVND